MLLRDAPPAKLTNRTATRRRKYTSQKNTVNNQTYSSNVVAKKRIKPATSIAKPVQAPSVENYHKPLWLKGLMVLNHTSAFVSFGSVAVALVMYGMTVYAPKLWTQKYTQLQELQKKERQFTYTDEMLKDGLAQSATQSSSGLVQPNSQRQPIFLPNTAT